jgi:hypothetical protein
MRVAFEQLSNEYKELSGSTIDRIAMPSPLIFMRDMAVLAKHPWTHSPADNSTSRSAAANTSKEVNPNWAKR